MAAAQEVLKRLERQPVQVPVPGLNDAKTGSPITITLGYEDFQKTPALRSVDGPAFVLSLFHRHYDEWAFVTNASRRGGTTLFPVITALIDTSLGVTPRRRHLLRTDPATALLGQWNFDSYLATADIWPTADVGDDFRAEVVTSIPVVFIHGDWDLQTPIENTLQIAPFFPKSHVMIVERGGHGAMNQVGLHHPETMQALIDYLKTGNMERLPTRVAVPAPKFRAPNFPPPGGSGK
jgi:pimeloyl-ACP methyl ester carboxylesterase